MPTTPSCMRSRYFMPLFSLFLGALVLGAFALCAVAVLRIRG
jgi:hypothetical protein